MQTSVSEESKLQILNDHYKDSFAQLIIYKKSRDRLLIAVFGTAGIQLFQLFSPKDADSTIGAVIAKQLGVQSPPDMLLITTLIWIILVALVFKYFLAVVNVELHYDYIHQLEDSLNNTFGSHLFTREGKFYRGKSSMLSGMVWWIYNLILPIILGAAVISKIVSDWRSQYQISILLVINTIAAALICVGIVLFLHHRFSRKS